MRDESVSTTRHRFDKLWRVGRVPQHIAQSLDRSVQPAFKIDESIFVPQLLSQLVSRDEPTGSCDQGLQESQRLLWKNLAVAVVRQLAGAHVQLEWAEAYGMLGGWVEHR